MKIWRLRCDDDIAWTDSPEWGHERSLLFDGRSHSDGWSPFEVGFVEEAEGYDDYDALVFMGGTQLLISEKAQRVMLDAAPDEVEFLPVLYKGQQRWLLNATCVLDCLDLDTCDYKTFSSGRIMWIYKYGFKESAVEHHMIFRAQGFPYNGPYVTDCFKYCIEKAGLKGFKFELLWDSSAEGNHGEKGDSEAIGDQESVFDYVGELDQNAMDEIREASARAAQVAKAGPSTSPKEVAEWVGSLIDEMLSQCDKADEPWMPSAAMDFGCLYGDAICREYGWKWMAFGPDEQSAAFGVVSPDGNYCLAPMPFLLKMMKGENIGPDGQNDNTVVLLFNMLDGIDNRPGEKRMIPLA